MEKRPQWIPRKNDCGTRSAVSDLRRQIRQIIDPSPMTNNRLQSVCQCQRVQLMGSRLRRWLGAEASSPEYSWHYRRNNTVCICDPSNYRWCPRPFPKRGLSPPVHLSENQPATASFAVRREIHAECEMFQKQAFGRTKLNRPFCVAFGEEEKAAQKKQNRHRALRPIWITGFDRKSYTIEMISRLFRG